MSEEMHPRRWASAVGVALLLSGGASAFGAGPARIDPLGASAARSGAIPIGAHISRALSVNDTGHLHLLKAFGSVLMEEGSVGGTLPGRAKVRLTVGSTVTASFTIRASGGAIYGSGRAALHSSGRYASFGGSLSVSHGSGRYARAHGSGRLYGVIDRRTDALTVQTVGTLSY